MHRLFIAIRPPPFIRSRLLALMEGVAGVRWQDDDQLHLTLRFIGEVEPHRANDLADLLGTVRFRPFPIELSGVGSFEQNGRTHSLWVGVRPREPLLALHRKVDRLCAAVGLDADSRAYLPHLTIARCTRSTGPLENFLESNAGVTSPPFPVDGFSLFESRLGHAGAVYYEIAHYPAEGMQGPASGETRQC